MKNYLFTALIVAIFVSCSSSSNNNSKSQDNSGINEEAINEVAVDEQIQVEQIQEEQIVEEPVVEEPSFLLTPGVVYTAYQMVDAWGGKERHTIELTMYKDGSYTGKLTLTAINEYRNDETDLTNEFEGYWTETSKRDKRNIEFIIQLDNADGPIDANIDEDLYLHCKELFKEPVQLQIKREDGTIVL